MNRHAHDPLPRSYRRLQGDGERLVLLRYLRPMMARWFHASDPERVSDLQTDALTLHAEFFGVNAPVGPQHYIGHDWVREHVDPHVLELAREHLERELGEHLRSANRVADQGERVEYSFSITVYATARVKAWPDDVPGLTAIPWRLVPDRAVLLSIDQANRLDVHRVVIPSLMRIVREAEAGGAFRCAVLCEPVTASWARWAGLDEYFEIVEDERQKRGVLRVAEEAPA